MSLYNITFYDILPVCKRGCFLEGPYQVSYLYFSWDRHKGLKNRVCELITGETINREPRAIAQDHFWHDY